MKIGLIRHGQTDWNALGKIQGQTDIPLNEQGRTQARMLGERLKHEDYRWDFIITSGLSRAEETGSILSSILDIPMLVPDPRVRERSYGLVEGLTSQEREERYGKDWMNTDVGQENDAQLQERGKAFLEDMICRYPEGSFLVVSHGGFLAQFYTLLYSNARTKERIGNLSLTIVEKRDLAWEPLLFNCTKHLMEDKTVESSS
ncbi:histidine phosphatase family protein [Paenibacillus lemnae]|uniref:Histidine phosphatase family protein n=1 Tax=Paenibacillus lemnae TaxID=1330551 RepID=A0A848M733_PAELE|nr:histidine phosphatase family protein [Paenibacillus lemnae]NMO96988.1 histidine phosphatase family protein [Paenibacillus lemnae]